MRKLIFIAILFSGMCAWAQADAVVANEKIPDNELADIKIVVTDIGHPVYAPLQLAISALCKDNRVSKTASVPKWTPVRRTQAICAWGGHSYDAASKKLVINFSEAAMVVGDAPCEPLPAKALDIKKHCAAWNK